MHLLCAPSVGRVLPAPCPAPASCKVPLEAHSSGPFCPPEPPTAPAASPNPLPALRTDARSHHPVGCSGNPGAGQMRATSVSPPAAYLGGGRGGVTDNSPSCPRTTNGMLQKKFMLEKEKNPLASRLETLQTLNRLYDLDKRSSGPPTNGRPGRGRNCPRAGRPGRSGPPGGPASRGASPPRPGAAGGA